ncbi:MAG: endonuclease III [Rhizobiaceae bacterium]|nr:endonuclease III [Rhizobiaceae bacterium]
MAENAPPAKSPRPPKAGDALSHAVHPANPAPLAARPIGKAKSAVRRPRIPYAKAEIAEIFRRFEMQRPEPKPELDFADAFTLLVAVVLSAQATDVGVNKATRGLFAAAPTPAAMLELGEDAVREHIRTIGLFRTKAKNVVALCRVLVETHGGAVPHDRAALEALPGVGRKTANVVLNTAFGEKTLAVDTHIFRIGNRLRLAPGKTPDAVEKGLLAIIPDAHLRHAHHWLILHGRYVCKARKPECAICIIADLCKAEVKTCDVPALLVPIEALADVRPPGQT